MAEITIRLAETEDWEDIAEMMPGETVYSQTLQLPYVSRDAVREHLENIASDHYRLVAVIDERVVGQLGMQPGTGRQAHVAYIGMMVHLDFQGQGVGSALMDAAVNLAENWLNLSRIELSVFTDNEAGLALYRKFDFEIEGTLREYAYRDGQYVDAYMMARIREDD
jgi:putative acetyltransferase